MALSDLASQLSKISTGNTVVLDRKKQKALHSKSLVFEPKQAINQDYETILSFSLDGLSELEILDPRFSAFRFNLFSDTSLNLDRNLQVSSFFPYNNLTIHY